MALLECWCKGLESTVAAASRFERGLLGGG